MNKKNKDRKFITLFFESNDFLKISRACEVSGLPVTSLIRTAVLKECNRILKEYSEFDE